MSNGYAKRTDANHKQVVDDLRKWLHGCTVFDASGAGKGFPDLVVGWKGHNFLFELKDPEKPTSRRSLTDAQKKLFDQWQGQIHIAHSAAEVCAVIAEHVFNLAESGTNR